MAAINDVKALRGTGEGSSLLSCAFLLDTPKLNLPVDDEDDGSHRDGDHES